MQWFLENELFIPLGSLLHIDGIRGEQFLTRNFPLVAHNILTANRVPRWIGTNNNFTWSIVRRVRWNKLIKAYWEHNIFRKDIVCKIDLFIIFNFLPYYQACMNVKRSVYDSISDYSKTKNYWMVIKMLNHTSMHKVVSHLHTRHIGTIIKQ